MPTFQGQIVICALICQLSSFLILVFLIFQSKIFRSGPFKTAHICASASLLMPPNSRQKSLLGTSVFLCQEEQRWESLREHKKWGACVSFRCLATCPAPGQQAVVNSDNGEKLCVITGSANNHICGFLLLVNSVTKCYLVLEYFKYLIAMR